MTLIPAILRQQYVGFERLFDELETVASLKYDTYPPHNIVKESDTEQTIELAVAGFNSDNINIEVEKGVLSISGKKEDTRDYLHKGISARAFTRSFRLGDHVEVKEASYSDGILSIKIQKNIPEYEKPKKIPLKKSKIQLNG